MVLKLSSARTMSDASFATWHRTHMQVRDSVATRAVATPWHSLLYHCTTVSSHEYTSSRNALNQYSWSTELLHYCSNSLYYGGAQPQKQAAALRQHKKHGPGKEGEGKGSLCQPRALECLQGIGALTSVPAMPMATPMSANFRAGASFTPVQGAYTHQEQPNHRSFSSSSELVALASNFTITV